MVQESCLICVDSSDYMRNGDFAPTRLQCQRDAVNVICQSKVRMNPENCVGLLAMGNNTEVLATLSTDSGKIMAKLHQVQPNGSIKLNTAVRVAHLVLKHRQSRNQKMRIVIFVGSPVDDSQQELIKTAKRLKKEKVNVDIVNFGEDKINTEKLAAFVDTLNGKDKDTGGSHLLTVPPGPLLSEALATSPILAGEDGVPAGMPPPDGGFGLDAGEDPDLIMALRISMEEHRQQEFAAAGIQPPTATTSADGQPVGPEDVSMSEAGGGGGPTTAGATTAPRDIASMTEEEQLALAIGLSLTDSASGSADDQDAEMHPVSAPPAGAAMDAEQSIEDNSEAGVAASGPASNTALMEDDADDVDDDDDEDLDDVVNDPAFLREALGGLEGVDPDSETVRQAVERISSATKDSVSIESKDSSSGSSGGDSSSGGGDSSKKKDPADKTTKK